MPSSKRIKAEQLATQRAAEKIPLLVAAKGRRLAGPGNITPEDTANLALYGVQHILEDNEKDRNEVICSKVCNVVVD